VSPLVPSVFLVREVHFFFAILLVSRRPQLDVAFSFLGLKTLLFLATAIPDPANA